MLNRSVCSQPEYRKSYCKLISAAVELASLLTEQEKQQLEVYQIWTLCMSEVFTDDSFAFGKNMSKFKALSISFTRMNNDL